MQVSILRDSFVRGGKTCICFCIFTTVAHCTATFAEDDELLSCGEIAATIRESLVSLQNIYVTCSVSTELLPGQFSDTEASYFFVESEDEFATDGRRFFRFQKYWEGPAEARVLIESYNIFNGEKTAKRFSSSKEGDREVERPVVVVSGLDENKFFPQNVYWESIGSWYYDGSWIDAWQILNRPDPIATFPFSILTALDSGAYVVSSELHQLDGTDCYLVEAGTRDRMWLDPRRNFAILRRDWLLTGTDNGLLRFSNKKLRKVASCDIWVPYRVEREFIRNPSEDQENSVLRTTCVVNKLVTNQSLEHLLSIDLAQGTEVLDGTVFPDAGVGAPLVSYKIGSSPESTEDNIEYAIENYGIKEYVQKQRSKRIKSWALGLAATISLVLVVGLAIKHRRSTS